MSGRTSSLSFCGRGGFPQRRPRDLMTLWLWVKDVRSGKNQVLADYQRIVFAYIVRRLGVVSGSVDTLPRPPWQGKGKAGCSEEICREICLPWDTEASFKCNTALRFHIGPRIPYCKPIQLRLNTLFFLTLVIPVTEVLYFPIQNWAGS